MSNGGIKRREGGLIESRRYFRAWWWRRGCSGLTIIGAVAAGSRCGQSNRGNITPNLAAS